MKAPYAAHDRPKCHRSFGEEIRATIGERGSEDQLAAENPAVKTGTKLDAWGGYMSRVPSDSRRSATAGSRGGISYRLRIRSKAMMK